MKKLHVGSVVVIAPSSTKGRDIPVGIITDRDLGLALGAMAKPQDVMVEQVMHSAPITANVRDSIHETVARMRKYGIKRMPVVLDDESLYGVISAEDLMDFYISGISEIGKISEERIKNEKSARSPLVNSINM